MSFEDVGCDTRLIVSGFVAPKTNEKGIMGKNPARYGARIQRAGGILFHASSPHCMRARLPVPPASGRIARVVSLAQTGHMWQEEGDSSAVLPRGTKEEKNLCQKDKA